MGNYMKIKKIISITVVFCFVFSFVLNDSLRAALSVKIEPNKSAPAFEDFVIPQNMGLITDVSLSADNYSPSTLVINIQDLHCHPEVQKNIAGIISCLDTNYGLNNVYVEGGYGEIDTSWLCNISDSGLKNKILEKLLDQGRLTGSEYYSAKSNRPYLLRGIEDEKIHKENIARLGKILDKQPYFEEINKIVDKDIVFMQSKYCSAKNRKFNSIVERYRKGKISGEKYYKLLNEYAQKINNNPDKYNSLFSVNINDYPNIKTFIELSNIAKQIKYKKVAVQLQQFIQIMKTRLPYNEYALLIKKTDNFSKTYELYAYLSQIIKRPEFLDKKAQFDELNKFFEYTKKNMEINPLQMINEEKRFVSDIRIGLAGDVNEIEVSFLVDFCSYFKEFLQNKLSFEDYVYFGQRYEKFSMTWSKYTTLQRKLISESDFNLLNDFYKTNCERNQLFLENIKELEARSTEHESGTFSPQIQASSTKVLELLKNSKIIVMVTGGFHSDGLKKIFEERGISYLTITPNITQDTKYSNEIYTKIAREQARQSMQLGLFIQEPFVEKATLELKAISKNEVPKLLKEIEKNTGIKVVNADTKKGIIVFDNGTEIKLEKNEENIKVTRLPAGSIKTVIKKTINRVISLITDEVYRYVQKEFNNTSSADFNKIREMYPNIRWLGGDWWADESLMVEEKIDPVRAKELKALKIYAETKLAPKMESELFQKTVNALVNIKLPFGTLIKSILGMLTHKEISKFNEILSEILVAHGKSVDNGGQWTADDKFKKAIIRVVYPASLVYRLMLGISQDLAEKSSRFTQETLHRLNNRFMNQKLMAINSKYMTGYLNKKMSFLLPSDVKVDVTPLGSFLIDDSPDFMAIYKEFIGMLNKQQFAMGKEKVQTLKDSEKLSFVLAFLSLYDMSNKIKLLNYVINDIAQGDISKVYNTYAIMEQMYKNLNGDAIDELDMLREVCRNIAKLRAKSRVSGINGQEILPYAILSGNVNLIVNISTDKKTNDKTIHYKVKVEGFNNNESMPLEDFNKLCEGSSLTMMPAYPIGANPLFSPEFSDQSFRQLLGLNWAKTRQLEQQKESVIIGIIKSKINMSDKYLKEFFSEEEALIIKNKLKVIAENLHIYEGTITGSFTVLQSVKVPVDDNTVIASYKAITDPGQLLNPMEEASVIFHTMMEYLALYDIDDTPLNSWYKKSTNTLAMYMESKLFCGADDELKYDTLNIYVRRAGLIVDRIEVGLNGSKKIIPYDYMSVLDNEEAAEKEKIKNTIKDIEKSNLSNESKKRIKYLMERKAEFSKKIRFLVELIEHRKKDVEEQLMVVLGKDKKSYINKLMNNSAEFNSLISAVMKNDDIVKLRRERIAGHLRKLQDVLRFESYTSVIENLDSALTHDEIISILNNSELKLTLLDTYSYVTEQFNNPKTSEFVNLREKYWYIGNLKDNWWLESNLKEIEKDNKFYAGVLRKIKAYVEKNVAPRHESNLFQKAVLSIAASGMPFGTLLKAIFGLLNENDISVFENKIMEVFIAHAKAVNGDQWVVNNKIKKAIIRVVYPASLIYSLMFGFSKKLADKYSRLVQETLHRINNMFFKRKLAVVDSVEIRKLVQNKIKFYMSKISTIEIPTDITSLGRYFKEDNPDFFKIYNEYKSDVLAKQRFAGVDMNNLIKHQKLAFVLSFLSVYKMSNKEKILNYVIREIADKALEDKLRKEGKDYADMKKNDKITYNNSIAIRMHFIYDVLDSFYNKLNDNEKSTLFALKEISDSIKSLKNAIADENAKKVIPYAILSGNINLIVLAMQNANTIKYQVRVTGYNNNKPISIETFNKLFPNSKLTMMPAYPIGANPLYLPEVSSQSFRQLLGFNWSKSSVCEDEAEIINDLREINAKSGQYLREFLNEEDAVNVQNDLAIMIENLQINESDDPITGSFAVFQRIEIPTYKGKPCRGYKIIIDPSQLFNKKEKASSAYHTMLETKLLHDLPDIPLYKRYRHNTNTMAMYIEGKILCKGNDLVDTVRVYIRRSGNLVEKIKIKKNGTTEETIIDYMDKLLKLANKKRKEIEDSKEEIKNAKDLKTDNEKTRYQYLLEIKSDFSTLIGNIINTITSVKIEAEEALAPRINEVNYYTGKFYSISNILNDPNHFEKFIDEIKNSKSIPEKNILLNNLSVIQSALRFESYKSKIFIDSKLTAEQLATLLREKQIASISDPNLTQEEVRNLFADDEKKGKLVHYENNQLLVKWKLDGVSDLEIAERIAALELIPSLNPIKYINFFVEHFKYYKGGNFSRVLGTAMMWAVSTAKFATANFSGFRYSGVQGFSKATAMKAAMEAQIEFHSRWDIFAIKNTKIGVIHIGGSEQLMYDNSLVTHKYCINAQDAAEMVKKTMGTDNLKCGKMEKDNDLFTQCIVIDHTKNIENTKRELSVAGINKVPVILSDDFSIDGVNSQNAVIQRILNENHAVSFTFAGNIGLKVDDDFVKTLEVHNLAPNSNLYIEVDKLSPEMKIKITALSDELRRCGVIVYFINADGSVQMDNEKKEVREFNLQTNLQLDPYSDVILDIKIPEKMTENEIRNAFAKLNLSQKMMLRSKEIRNNIKKFRDITDQKAFASFFNILINLGQKNIFTTAEAKSFGMNWELPLADDTLKQAELLLAKNYEGLNALIGKDHVQSLIDEVNKLDPKLRDSFFQGLIAKTLIKAKLFEKNAELAQEYATNKYKINSVDESKLGDVLLISFAKNATITGDFDILNLIISDWRLSKPIRKEGLGIINTNNFKLVLGAA